MHCLSSQTIPDVLSSATAWDSHASLPWINWNMGGSGRQRVAPLAGRHPLGRSLVLLFFPGTITLYYGDELDSSSVSQVSIIHETNAEVTNIITQGKVSLMIICLPHAQDDDWSSLMAWNSDADAGFSSTDPWKPLNAGWEDENVENQNYTISTLSTMVMARQEKVRQNANYYVCLLILMAITLKLAIFEGEDVSNRHHFCSFFEYSRVLVYFFELTYR